MNLLKLIPQLSEKEYESLLTSFVENNAEKTATYFQLLREDPEAADDRLRESIEITPAAYYVLKSRLNQRVEQFLLDRLEQARPAIGDELQRVGDAIFFETREVSLAMLYQLERIFTDAHQHQALAQVYKHLQALHAFDEKHDYYAEKFRQQLDLSTAQEMIEADLRSFFRSYDRYYLNRGETNYQETIRVLRRFDEAAQAYDSPRIAILRALVTGFARLHLELPADFSRELPTAQEFLAQAFEIMDAQPEDVHYQNLRPVFHALAFIQAVNDGNWKLARVHMLEADEYANQLLAGYNLMVNTGHYLQAKVTYHLATGSMEEMQRDVELFFSNIQPDTYRVSTYFDHQMYLARTYFLAGDYEEASRVLFFLNSEVYLRKDLHAHLELRLFQALIFTVMGEVELAQQSLLSLRRHLRKPEMQKYGQARELVRGLGVYLGKSAQREEKFAEAIEKWNRQNEGRHALLAGIEIEKVLRPTVMVVEQA